MVLDRRIEPNQISGGEVARRLAGLQYIPIYTEQLQGRIYLGLCNSRRCVVTTTLLLCEHRALPMSV